MLIILCNDANSKFLVTWLLYAYYITNFIACVHHYNKIPLSATSSNIGSFSTLSNSFLYYNITCKLSFTISINTSVIFEF